MQTPLHSFEPIVKELDRIPKLMLSTSCQLMCILDDADDCLETAKSVDEKMKSDSSNQLRVLTEEYLESIQEAMRLGNRIRELSVSYMDKLNTYEAKAN